MLLFKFEGIREICPIGGVLLNISFLENKVF